MTVAPNDQGWMKQVFTFCLRNSHSQSTLIWRQPHSLGHLGFFFVFFFLNFDFRVFYIFIYLFIYLFIWMDIVVLFYLFIFGCVGSSFLCEGFL